MLYAFLVQVHEKEERADPLVSVGEGMILHDEVEQVRRFFFAGAIERFAEHGLLDAAENSLQRLAARIAEKRRRLITRHQFLFEFSDRSRSAVIIQYANGWLGAGRRRQSILVVLKEQAPGVGVACNKFQDSLPCVVHQRLVPERPIEEIERFPGFSQAALLQAGLNCLCTV